MCCKFVKQKEVFMLWVSIWQLLLLEKFRSSHVYQMLGGFWHAHFHCCPRVALSSPLDMKSWSQSLFQRERFQASHIDLQERQQTAFLLSFCFETWKTLRLFTLCQILMPSISRVFPTAWCSNSATPAADSKDTSLGPKAKEATRKTRQNHATRNSQLVTLSEVKRRNRCKRSETVWSRFVLKSSSWIQLQFLFKDPLSFVWNLLGQALVLKSSHSGFPTFSRKIRQRGQDEKKQFALHICWVSLPDCQTARPSECPFHSKTPYLQSYKSLPGPDTPLYGQAGSSNSVWLRLDD